jgi:hypothetical protein
MSPTGLWPVDPATAGTAVLLTGKMPVLRNCSMGVPPMIQATAGTAVLLTGKMPVLRYESGFTSTR